MRILNVEDSPYKHRQICDVLAGAGERNIDVESTLDAALARIKAGFEEGMPYQLIITDMWYPENSGGPDAQSGDKLIELVKQNGWEIPVIVCSSVNYKYPGILGSIHYSENEDWETELVRLLKKL